MRGFAALVGKGVLEALAESQRILVLRHVVAHVAAYKGNALLKLSLELSHPVPQSVLRFCQVVARLDVQGVLS